MREIWIGEDRTSDYIKSMKNKLLVDDTDNVKRAIKDIHKCQIFDEELKIINDKYAILGEKYPEIVDTILDILFPEFFRDIIKEDFIKNVTFKNNVLTR